VIRTAWASIRQWPPSTHGTPACRTSSSAGSNSTASQRRSGLKCSKSWEASGRQSGSRAGSLCSRFCADRSGGRDRAWSRQHRDAIGPRGGCPSGAQHRAHDAHLSYLRSSRVTAAPRARPSASSLAGIEHCASHHDRTGRARQDRAGSLCSLIGSSTNGVSQEMSATSVRPDVFKIAWPVC
jgi:hypothetical protein